MTGVLLRFRCDKRLNSENTRKVKKIRIQVNTFLSALSDTYWKRASRV